MQNLLLRQLFLLQTEYDQLSDETLNSEFSKSEGTPEMEKFYVVLNDIKASNQRIHLNLERNLQLKEELLIDKDRPESFYCVDHIIRNVIFPELESALTRPKPMISTDDETTSRSISRKIIRDLILSSLENKQCTIELFTHKYGELATKSMQDWLTQDKRYQESQERLLEFGRREC